MKSNLGFIGFMLLIIGAFIGILGESNTVALLFGVGLILVGTLFMIADSWQWTTIINIIGKMVFFISSTSTLVIIIVAITATITKPHKFIFLFLATIGLMIFSIGLMVWDNKPETETKKEEE